MKNKLNTIKKLIKFNSFVRFTKITDRKTTSYFIEIEPDYFYRKEFKLNHYQFINLLVYVSNKDISFKYDFASIWF